jgi:hypothetical protein
VFFAIIGMAKEPKPLPVIAAHLLEQRRTPFDDPDWLFEVKADRLRSGVCPQTVRRLYQPKPATGEMITMLPSLARRIWRPHEP